MLDNFPTEWGWATTQRIQAELDDMFDNFRPAPWATEEQEDAEN